MINVVRRFGQMSKGENMKNENGFEKLMPFTKTEGLGKLRELRRLTQGIQEDTELKNSIIKNLFNSRKDSGLTVETIAEYSGVTRKTIYAIMNRDKEKSNAEV